MPVAECKKMFGCMCLIGIIAYVFKNHKLNIHGKVFFWTIVYDCPFLFYVVPIGIRAKKRRGHGKK